MRAWARVVVVLLALTGPGRARAAPDDASAKAAYEAGVALYGQRRWAAARARFEAAYRHAPHRELLYNIGSCYR